MTEESDVGAQSTEELENQLPSLRLEDGEVAVKKGSGKIKIRKGQTEEAYQEQLRQFHQEGPTINDTDWLLGQKATDVDIEDKVPVGKYIHMLELLYYKRDYVGCLEKCEEFLKMFLTDAVRNEREEAELKKKKKKSKTVVIIEEVEFIKEKCLTKKEQSS